MVEDLDGTDGIGASSALPRWAWVAIVALAGLAALSLLIPPDIATANGVPFRVFFWTVAAIQGAAGFGIAVLIAYYATS